MVLRLVLELARMYTLVYVAKTEPRDAVRY